MKEKMSFLSDMEFTADEQRLYDMIRTMELKDTGDELENARALVEVSQREFPGKSVSDLNDMLQKVRLKQLVKEIDAEKTRQQANAQREEIRKWVDVLVQNKDLLEPLLELLKR